MSETTPPSAKVCIICKQDCSKRPRTKDLQGRYTCKSCLEKQAASPKPKPAPKPAPAPVTAADENFDVMAGLIDQSPMANAPACDGCGMPMTPGAVVCLACGYNGKTGKRTAVSAARAPREPSKAAGVAAVAATAAAKGTFAVVAPIIGGVIGGAVGAAIWAGVAYGLHLHWGWIAWGVGVLAGSESRLARRETPGR